MSSVVLDRERQYVRKRRGVLVLTDEWRDQKLPVPEDREDMIVRRVTISVMSSWVQDNENLLRFSHRFDCSKVLQKKISTNVTRYIFEILAMK